MMVKNKTKLWPEQIDGRNMLVSSSQGRHDRESNTWDGVAEAFHMTRGVHFGQNKAWAKMEAWKKTWYILKLGDLYGY